MDDEDERPTSLVGGEAASSSAAAPAAADVAPAAAASSSSAAEPPAPPAEQMGALQMSDNATAAENVSAAQSLEQLKAALKKTESWEYSPENQAGIDRAKTYVAGSDKEVLCGFFVSSINEWKVAQPRVLVLSTTAYYRVTYNPKNGKIDHYHKTTLDKLRVLEKTATSLKVYLTEQDGKASVGKMAGWLAQKVGAKEAKSDEFEHAREYLPALAVAEPGVDAVVDTMAATLAKIYELHSQKVGFDKTLDILTTSDRKNLLAERKEAARLEKERVEREAAEAELTKALEEAREKTKPDLLDRPLRRCKKAVEANPALMEKAEKLRTELEEEIKENERLARLERERVEREAATEELTNAINTAKESRDANQLTKPIKRAKKAVEVSSELIQQGEALKTELEEEKKEKERQEAEEKKEQERLAKLEREKVEREGAAEELKAALGGAKQSREAKALDKALKRAKKAVDFATAEGGDADMLKEGDELKAELDEEKKEKERQAKEAERLRKEEEKAAKEEEKAAKEKAAAEEKAAKEAKEAEEKAAKEAAEAPKDE